MSRRRSTLLIAVMLAAAPGARPAQAQRCPAVEVKCSERSADDDTLECKASVDGSHDEALTYLWSLSVRAPIKNHSAYADHIDIDLSDVPHDEVVTVSVSVTGLPVGCPSTATFESRASDDREAGPAGPFSGPTIIASCPLEVVEGAPLFFSAQISDADQSLKIDYRWKVSRGQIKSGQGTPSILVDTTDLGNQIVRAAVRVDGVEGLPRVSCATRVKALPKSYKLYEYDESTGAEEKTKHLYRLSLRLKIGLDERAYIVAYSRRGRPREESMAEANLARRFLVDERGVEPARVVVLDGGFRRAASVELWIVQNGATPPPTGNSGVTQSNGRR